MKSQLYSCILGVHLWQSYLASCQLWLSIDFNISTLGHSVFHQNMCVVYQYKILEIVFNNIYQILDVLTIRVNIIFSFNSFLIAYQDTIEPYVDVLSRKFDELINSSSMQILLIFQCEKYYCLQLNNDLSLSF